jgi:hypothetical protein
MRKALPADTILFVDIGNVMAWALHYYTVREPGGFFINMGFGSMGHGVAAAIGGKLAAPDRPVVALTGDAAFAMNGLEVHTAVENDVPVVWVVLNNGGHGMVHLGETQQFQGRFNTSLFRRKLNVAQIADAVGALCRSSWRSRGTRSAPWRRPSPPNAPPSSTRAWTPRPSRRQACVWRLWRSFSARPNKRAPAKSRLNLNFARGRGIRRRRPDFFSLKKFVRCPRIDLTFFVEKAAAPLVSVPRAYCKVRVEIRWDTPL